MRLTVNGEAMELDERPNVADVVVIVGARREKGTAVAVNGEVVPRGRWTDTSLSEGDRVEVLDAMGGG